MKISRRNKWKIKKSSAPKRKPSFRFYLPYVLLAALLAIVVWYAFKPTVIIKTVTENSLRTYFDENIITNMTVTEREKVTTITGVTSTGERFQTQVSNQWYETYYETVVLAEDAEMITIDAFKATFWDTWGPTLLVTGGSLLLVMFLFSKMANSVSGSNNKAMDFNRSRARLETKKVKTFAGRGRR